MFAKIEIWSDDGRKMLEKTVLINHYECETHEIIMYQDVLQAAQIVLKTVTLETEEK